MTIQSKTRATSFNYVIAYASLTLVPEGRLLGRRLKATLLVLIHNTLY